MGLPKTKLEYVNASGNWTQAVTPSGQDAVIMLHIAQGINTSSKCDVIMANQSPDPGNSDPAQAKGNLTDIFTDFQRIRLVDQETGIVIFTGRIYRIRDKYDLQYGQTIRLYGFDAYKELLEYPIDDPPDSLKSIDTTSSNLGGFDVRKRSQLIKYILSELDLNDNISVSDTDHWDDSWSTNSFQDKDLNISKIDRRIAGVIQDLAIGDPLKNVSGTDIGESGYDFRVEPYFTSCAVNHKPIEMMNYFQRGTRPGRGGAYSNESSPTLCTTSTDSLTIQYPSAGDTGLLRSMLSSFEFDKPKEELYTSLVLHYTDESQEEQNANQEGSSKKEGVVTFELFKGTTSGTFTWADKALDSSKATPTELLNISGGATGVARVQWHESNYLLVSDINEDTFPTTGSITLVGADSSATFTMNAATQRMVTKIGVKRPIRIQRNLTSNLYALRKEVVARLIGRTDLEIVRGKFQTIRYPYVYHDLPSNASRSTNTITWSGTVDAQARGIRKAYVVAQIDSDGNYVRYAYISAVNSATSISYGTGATDTSDDTALDVTDTIRLIVPIRPGDVVKAVHTTSNINTDQVILELLYDESPGIMGANYTTVGSNGKFNNIFSDSDAVKSAIAQAQSKKLPPEQPLSEQAFVFDGFINRGSNPSDSNDYRKIHWTNSAGNTSGTAGTLTAGDGTKYTIACANSATLTEAEHTFFFRPTSAKATANKSNTTFQLVLATNYVKDPSDIRLGWAKAVPNKAGAKAILVLAPQLQSRDLFAAGGVGTLTDALFSKSAQEYASGLEIKPVTSGSNLHRRVTWAACTSAEDRLTFGDGDYWSIAADGGNYSYTANGSSYTNLQLLDESSTYYVFIDTADTASGGTLTLRFTKSYSHISTASDGTYSSARVIMGQIAVPANGNDGAAPRIFPFNNRSLTINAASIAADAITATHITAGTVTTIRQGTTKADVGLGNVDNDSTNTVRGGVTPLHVSDNMTGVTMDQNGNIYSGSKTTYGSNTAGWFIGIDSGTPKINIGSGTNRIRWTGSALEIIGQIQLTSGGTALSEANTLNAQQAWSDVSGSGKPDDNATEGLGGTGFRTGQITTDITGGNASLPTFTGSDTIVDSKGICGFASNALQFYLLSSTGKAYFGAGSIIADRDGLAIAQGNSKAIEFGSSRDVFIQYYTAQSGGGNALRLGKDGSFEVEVVGSLVPGVSAGSNLGKNAGYGGFEVLYLAKPNSSLTPVALTVNSSGELLVAGSAVGGSSSFPLLAPDGSNSAPSYAWDSDNNSGMKYATSGSYNGTAFIGNGDYMAAFWSTGSSALLSMYGSIDMNNYAVYDAYRYSVRNDGEDDEPNFTWGSHLTSGMYWNDGPAISRNGITRMKFGGYEITAHDDIRPSTNDYYDIGGYSYKWDDIYATNGTINTSDRREKTNILPTTLGLSFINDLNPISYKWLNKKNKETHHGLVAQEVIETLTAHGIDYTLDFGGITGSEDTAYGARYTEFVAILIKAVQELSERIVVLEGGQ